MPLLSLLVASKRLQLLASLIKGYGKLYGVKKLVVADNCANHSLDGQIMDCSRTGLSGKRATE